MRLYIFDMGEVVLLGVNVLRRMAEHYDIDYDAFRADYNLYDKPLMDGYMDSADYYSHMRKAFAVDISGDPFSLFFTPTLNQRVLDYADRLRARGDRVVIGSNTFEPHWKALSDRYIAIREHFDALYASHLMHISKPVPAFWRIIMEAEGVKADDSFFIDDRLDNIEAAESLGIRCFRYQRNDEELEAFLSL